MTLQRILTRKSLVLLGLNSGTSADGLDMAVMRISRNRRSVSVTYLGGYFKPYSDKLRDYVLRIADSKTVDLNEVIHLDSLLGRFLGRAATAFIKRLTRNHVQVNAIASHGQTVRHLPHKVPFGRYSVNGTLQLGAPEHIATATGKTVVADFRQADIAIGNEGAPITSGAMRRLLATPAESRLIVNIGGIANYFYFPKEKSRLKPSAADCGPGNSLSDILSQRLFAEKFDRRGSRASQGKVSQRLLTHLLSSSFFSDKTISTGREDFGVIMARELLNFGQSLNLNREDLFATAAELTADAIAMKIRPLLLQDRSLSKLYLTGGGRKNTFLVNRLRHHLPEVEIHRADELGINGDFIEAAAYALMGEACLRSESLSIPAKTRANPSGVILPVLGRIVQPPLKRKK